MDFDRGDCAYDFPLLCCRYDPKVSVCVGRIWALKRIITATNLFA